MSTTEDGVLRRQATFDTEPINERKQGVNLQLPVIEGDKEIKPIEPSVQDIKPPDNLTNEPNVKNRTRIIDTKATIDAGVKAISEKAKNQQKIQNNETEELAKKGVDLKNTKPTKTEGNSKVNAPSKETNEPIVTSVKAVNEKEKGRPKENKKNNSGTHAKTISESTKGQREHKEHVKVDNKLAHSNALTKTVAVENTKNEAPISSINKTSTAKSNNIESKTHTKTNKKSDDKSHLSKDKEESHNKVDSSRKEPKHKTTSKAKLTHLPPVSEDKQDSISVGKGIKVKNTDKTKADSTYKEVGKNTGSKEKKHANQQIENTNKSNETVEKISGSTTDKSKIKAGISERKDTHAVTGITVGNGTTNKVKESESNTRVKVSKLTVGSAPAVTTIGGLQQTNITKEQKETEEPNNKPLQKTSVIVPNNKPLQKTSVNKVLDKSPDFELETVKKLSSPKSESITTHQNSTIAKTTSEKTIQESNYLNDTIKMENTGIFHAEGRRGESYEAIYAERNTLLKAELAYKRRIKQLEDEANGFLKSIEELTSENNSLHAKLESIEKDQSLLKHSTSDEQTLKLIQEKAELENKIQKLEKHSSLSDDAKEISKDANIQINELKAQVVKLQTENQNVNEELIKEKAEHMNDLKKLRAMEKESKSLANSVTAVESEKLDTIQDLQKGYSKLKDENIAQKNKITELEKKLNTLEFENKALSESLTQKKTELSELLGVMKDENKFDTEIKDLKSSVLKLEKEKKDIVNQHYTEKRKLEEENNEVKSKYNTSATELNELKIKLDELSSENKTFENDNKRLKSLCDSQKKEIDELKKEIQRLKAELKSIQEQLASLKQDTESATTNLQDTKSKLESTNKQLQTVVADKEAQITKLVAQVDTLNSEKDIEKNDFENEKGQLSAEVDRLRVFEKHMNNMEKELKHFVDKLEESESRRNQLSVQLEDRGYHVSSLEEQIFEFNMKVDTMTKRIGQLDREKREVETEKREWEVKRDKINDIESSNKRLMEENRRLRASLEDRTILDSNFNVNTEKAPKAREAWVSDPPPVDPIQKAIYVENKNGKKRVQIAPQAALPKRRHPFTKSSPVKNSKPPIPKKELRTSLSPSRSLEDVRRSPISPVESNPSLPELKGDGGLTYGFSYTQGYSQIHRNRIRAAQKRVY